MGPSATRTKSMFVFVIEFQSFPFMLMRLVIGQYLQCNFCIPALFKPNFCDVSKYTKYKISLEDLKSENQELEWGNDRSELGETHIQKVPITKSEQ